MDKGCNLNKDCPAAGLTAQTPEKYNACTIKQQAPEPVDGCKLLFPSLDCNGRQPLTRCENRAQGYAHGRDGHEGLIWHFLLSSLSLAVVRAGQRGIGGRGWRGFSHLGCWRSQDLFFLPRVAGKKRGLGWKPSLPGTTSQLLVLPFLFPHFLPGEARLPSRGIGGSSG